GIFQGLIVLITLLLFAPYAAYIPLASLAPILMVVAFNMSEHKSFIHMVKLKTSDSLVLIVTFLLTVFVNLTIAVPIGLLLAMASFIKRMSEVLEIERVIPARLKNSVYDDMQKFESTCPKISFFTVEGPLFFGAADKFESVITYHINKRPKVLILKMKHVSIIDATGIANLSSLVRDFHKTGGVTLFSEVNPKVEHMLKISGLYDEIGKKYFFQSSTDAVDYAIGIVDSEKCSLCSRKGSPS